MSSDMLAWTENAISKRETAARATTEHQPYDEWDAAGDDREDETVRSCWEVVGVARMRQTPAARDLAQHIVRRCAADRELIADITAERHHVSEDCWYTCAAATEEHDGEETCDDTRRGKPCDCGRDANVQRWLRIIAEGYGWQEGQTP